MVESDQGIADEQFLYLTTIGRKSGEPREIEIWFVIFNECFYLFAETGEAAGWVKNLQRNPKVWVRLKEGRIEATARVLDREVDGNLRDRVAALANRKYGWSDGLAVEVAPCTSSRIR